MSKKGMQEHIFVISIVFEGCTAHDRIAQPVSLSIFNFKGSNQNISQFSTYIVYIYMSRIFAEINGSGDPLLQT